MGLLSRAADKTSAAPLSPVTENEEEFFPDEMGKALIERILRLPQTSATPCTALSLLKAYGSFKAIFCLALKFGVYTSCASVGFGIAKLSIPVEEIWSAEKAAKKYFKIESGKNLEIASDGEAQSYWIFPMDQPGSNSAENKSSEPWERVMLLEVSDSPGVNSDFNPKSVSAIVSGISGSIFASANQKASETSPEMNALEEKITQFHECYPDFHCLLFEPAPSAGEDEKAGFYKKVSEIVDHAGSVIPLPSNRPLILLPAAADRELIAHRL